VRKTNPLTECSMCILRVDVYLPDAADYSNASTEFRSDASDALICSIQSSVSVWRPGPNIVSVRVSVRQCGLPSRIASIGRLQGEGEFLWEHPGCSFTQPLSPSAVQLEVLDFLRRNPPELPHYIVIRTLSSTLTACLPACLPHETYPQQAARVAAAGVR
jgi:hypothetical protein